MATGNQRSIAGSNRSIPSLIGPVGGHRRELSASSAVSSISVPETSSCAKTQSVNGNDSSSNSIGWKLFGNGSKVPVLGLVGRSFSGNHLAAKSSLMSSEQKASEPVRANSSGSINRSFVAPASTTALILENRPG